MGTLEANICLLQRDGSGGAARTRQACACSCSAMTVGEQESKLCKFLSAHAAGSIGRNLCNAATRLEEVVVHEMEGARGEECDVDEGFAGGRGAPEQGQGAYVGAGGVGEEEDFAGGVLLAKKAE